MRGRLGKGERVRGERRRDPMAMVLLVMLIDLVRQFLFFIFIFFLFNNGTRVSLTNTNETS
jgi:hypothetical protein